jgi:drug/metabolite transporter (DMT)-like permease
LEASQGFLPSSRMGGSNPVFNIVPLGFGAAMAGMDAMMLSFVKYMSQDNQYVKWMFIPMIVYAFQPVIFYVSLQYSSLTVMNLLLDLISDVLVTTIGLFVFQEKIGPYKRAGVILSFISIVLMSLNDGE